MNTGPPIRCPHHHGSLSRRQCFGTTAGVALGAALSDVSHAHFPIAPPGTTLANIDAPSQIIDLNGFVGLKPHPRRRAGHTR
jgi:hypothetical protein